MKAPILNDNHFLGDTIRRELEARIEKEIDGAVEDIKKKLRERVGEIAISLLKTYEIQTMNDNLVITVRHLTNEELAEL